MEEIKFKKLIASEHRCIEYLEQFRWQFGMYCPHCGGTNSFSKRKTPGVYHHNSCNRDFSVLSNSILQGTKLKVRDWFRLLKLMLDKSKSMSAYKLSYELELPYKTIWLCAMKVRAGMSHDKTISTQKLLEDLRIHINEELPRKKKSKEGFYKQFESAIENFLNTIFNSKNSVKDEKLDLEGAWNQIKSSIKRKYRNLGKFYFPFYLSEVIYHQNNRNKNENLFEEYIQGIMSKEKCVTSSFPHQSKVP